MFRSIAYHSRTIRLPVHVHNLLNRVRRTRLTLQQELGRTPSDEEMAAQLQMSPQKYIKMLRLTRRAISLEKPKYQNNPKDIGQESEMLLGDTIDATTVIPDENTPEQSVDQGFFQDDLKEMLTVGLNFQPSFFSIMITRVSHLDTTEFLFRNWYIFSNRII